jgi:glyoxylase-like metal-dependent hydrolase (beta-lactamase superfamily II)
MSVNRRSFIGLTAALITSAALPELGAAKSPLIGTQNAGFYRYKIGDIEATAITDGFAERPLDGFIKNAELADVKAVLAQSGIVQDKLRIPFTTTVLNMGDKLVLIDTGNGDSGAPNTGSWMANFKAAGFLPEQVDLVIFSHFHADHINGFRLKNGISPFTNAQVMVPAIEWGFWMDEGQMSRSPEGMKGAFTNIRRVFDIIKDKVIQYDAGKEIIPRLTAIAAFGHTPGHMAYRVSSGATNHILMSDTTNHPAIFVRKPEWSAIFDIDAAQAITSRRTMLDMAVAEGAIVSFYHAPFPATGKIVKDGTSYALIPTAWSVVL